MLSVLHSIPDGLLHVSAEQLHTILAGPTLIHLPGQRQPAMFISVLLHGNEHTSWEALRQVLQAYQDTPLPRALSIFIGNIDAARVNQRFIQGQPDFNRIWGTKHSPPHPIMQQVMDEMRASGVFFSVDVHNNTGLNPHYACVNRIDARYLYLASLFSRSVVYFLKPEGVQSLAFAELCPAVTVECGLSGDASGTEHVVAFLHDCLSLEAFPDFDFDARSLGVYHTVAVAKIPGQYSLGIDDPNKDISLDASVEQYNFTHLAAGTSIGSVKEGIAQPLTVTNEDGHDVSDIFVGVEKGRITLLKPLIPAMLTLDINTIKKDCVCYFMETFPLHDKL